MPSHIDAINQRHLHIRPRPLLSYSCVPSSFTRFHCARLRKSIVIFISLFLFFTCFRSCTVHAAVWDRAPFTPSGLVGSTVTLVEVKSHTIWANTARAAFGYPSPSYPATNASYPSAPPLPDYTSIIVATSGLNAFFTTTMKMYLMPWPLSSTPTQQERWVEAPVIATTPTPRDSNTLISTANSYSPAVVAGRLFLYGGEIASNSLVWQIQSLWTFDVESTTWSPLGPSRMFDENNPYGESYDCQGKPSELHDGPIIETVANKGTVDECGYSSFRLRQVDEFNCPWPAARAGHVMVTVGEYMYLYGGTFVSWSIAGDVWRLKLDSNLADAIKQQATSVGGVYVYNDDQLKYLQNRSDPTIVPGNLCPVKWEQLTREVNVTSSLKNRPETDPFPDNRWLTSVTASGSQLWVVSGQKEFTSVLTRDDVWMLETRNDDFRWFRIAGIPTGRSFHSVGSLYVPNLSNFVPDIVYDSSYSSCTNSPTVALGMVRGVSATANYLNDAWILIPKGCNQTFVAPPISPYYAPHSLLLPDNSPSLTWEWKQIPLTSVPEDAFTSANMQLPDGTFLFVSGQSRTGPVAGSCIYDIPHRFGIDLPTPFTGATTFTSATTTAVSTLYHAMINTTVQQQTPPSSPAPRFLHFSMYVESMRSMLVYAGRGSADFLNVYNDMWSYSVDTVSWTKVGDADAAKAAGQFWPPAHLNQAYASASDGVFYLFGGWPVQPDVFNYVDGSNVSPSPCGLTLYRYDLATNTWTNLTSAFKSVTTWNENTQGPVSSTAGEFRADGFVYPSGRCSSQLAVLNNGTELFVFGGDVGASTYTNPSDNSLWKLNLLTMEWQLLQKSDPTLATDPGPVSVTTQKQPATRRMHSMAKINECEFIMGWGLDRSRDVTYLGDLWIYSCTSGWRLVSNAMHDPNAIHPRAWAPITIRTVPKENGGDTFLVVSGGYQVPVLTTNDLYSFNTRTYETTQHFPMNEDAVATLNAAQLVSINQGNSLLLYGGNFLNSYVHELAFDECTVGVGKTPDRFAHDWLAILNFAPKYSFDVPIAYFSNSDQLATSTTTGYISVKPAPLAFTSLTFALLYYQRSLQTGASTFTIIDTTVTTRAAATAAASSRTTQYLSTVTLNTNVTIIGLQYARSVLNCGGAPNCGLKIDLGSSYCSGNQQGSEKIVTVKYLILTNSTQSDMGGFLSISNARVNLFNVSVCNNNASSFGGAISAVNSKLQMTNCNFTSNTAGKSGGALYLVNSEINITSCNFTRNVISGGSADDMLGYGQGGALSSMSSRVQITGSSLQWNSARVGGGISALETISIPIVGVQMGALVSGLTIASTCFTCNSASEDGGAIYASALAAGGGVQDISSLPVVRNSSFIRNVAQGNGGAVYLGSSRLVFNYTTFRANRCNLGGGAIYWSPGANDPMMQQAPIFFPSRSVAFPVSSGYKGCLGVTTMDSLKSALMWDPQCNAASYGPFLASPSASLRIVTESIEAASQPQTIGAFVSPIVIQLIDCFQQPLNVDNSTFISMGPALSFSGATTMQVVKGVATFDQVLLRIPPSSNVSLIFSSSIFLPFLLQDEGNGKVALTIQSNRAAPNGLQGNSNTSFAQVSSCTLGCSLTLTAPADAHSTMMQVTFNLGLFNHDYDQFIIWMDRGAASGIGSEIYQQYSGSSLASSRKNAVPQGLVHGVDEIYSHHGRGRRKDAVGGISSADGLTFSVLFLISSARIRIQLQTFDDRAGYVMGQMNFSSECPDGLQLSPSENECLNIRESSSVARITILVAAGIAACLVIFSIVLVLRYRLSPHFRAASASFSFTILGLLGCLCVGSILFALLPDRNSGLCIARIWFSTIPVIGVLSILLAKAYKVSSIAHNATATLKKASPTDSVMWGIVVTAILLQVGFCLAYGLVPISQFEFHSQTVDGSTIRYLVRECSTEDAFTPWFAAQLIYVGLIACATSFYSFQTRGVNMQYNESSHVAVSLFFIVLIAIILIPVGILVQNSPDAMVVVQGGGAAFVAIMLNLSLFFPKFSAVRAVLRQSRKLAAEKAKAEQQAKITAAQLYVTGTPRGNAALQQQAASSGSVSDSLHKHKGSLAKMKKSNSSSGVVAAHPLASSSARVVLTSTPEYQIQEEEDEDEIPIDRFNNNNANKESVVQSLNPSPVRIDDSSIPTPATSESKSVIVFHVDSKQSQQARQSSRDSATTSSSVSKLMVVAPLVSSRSDSLNTPPHDGSHAGLSSVDHSNGSHHGATASTTAATSAVTHNHVHNSGISAHSSPTTSAFNDANPIPSPSRVEPDTPFKRELAALQQHEYPASPNTIRDPAAAPVHTSSVDADFLFTLPGDSLRLDDDDLDMDKDDALRPSLYYRSRHQQALASEQSLLSASDSTLDPSKLHPVSLASIQPDLQ